MDRTEAASRPLELLGLSLLEHLALDDLAHFAGYPADLCLLRRTAAVARALAEAGYGADELPEVAKADAVLRRCLAGPNPDGITGVNQADLAPLRWLLAYADAQRAAASSGDYHRAQARVRQDDPSRYGA